MAGSNGAASRPNQEVMVCDYHGDDAPYRSKLVNLYQIDGLQRVPVETATVGDIVCFSGIENITIGNTVTDPADAGTPPLCEDQRTHGGDDLLGQRQPLCGQGGQVRHLPPDPRPAVQGAAKGRFPAGAATAKPPTASAWLGRGEMHLSILIETMRREGYEFRSARPACCTRKLTAKCYEPIEQLLIDVPEEAVGSVMEKMGQRKGELIQMAPQGTPDAS